MGESTHTLQRAVPKIQTVFPVIQLDLDKWVVLVSPPQQILESSKRFNVNLVMDLSKDTNDKSIQPVPITVETCLGCHDETNSPDFDFETYLRQLPAKVNRFVVEELLDGISFYQLLRLILTSGTNFMFLMLNNSSCLKRSCCCKRHKWHHYLPLGLLRYREYSDYKSHLYLYE